MSPDDKVESFKVFELDAWFVDFLGCGFEGLRFRCWRTQP